MIVGFPKYFPSTFAGFLLTHKLFKRTPLNFQIMGVCPGKGVGWKSYSFLLLRHSGQKAISVS